MPTHTHLSHPDGEALAVTHDGRTFLVEPSAEASSGTGANSQWRVLDEPDGHASLSLASGDMPLDAHMLAALDAAFVSAPHRTRIALPGSMAPGLAGALSASGTAWPDADGQAVVHREAFWQQARMWLPAAPLHCPLQYTMTQGRRHPRRAPKPCGTVYRRHIPWLNRTLTLRTLDIEQDLPAFNRWMNDPVVAKFWQEGGDMAKHRAYIEAIHADPRATGLLMCLDGRAFGYVEAYWAKEDRIAPFCDAQDHDRGWHVLVGEADCRGKPFLTAWMPSVSHYLFLDDCRTQRIVIEPRADNDRMIRSLGRCGYALLKEFDFPHKRAMLATLSRERFFGEALWTPRPSS